MYYIYRRRTLHIKKHPAPSFCCTHQIQWKNQKKHAQNVCPPKIDVYKKYTPKHKVMEFETKNPTHQKSTGNNPPNQLVSTQFFLDVLLLDFLFSQFFLDLWWFSPKFSTLFSPQAFGSSFPARPWILSIFASPVPRQRPNVPGPQGWRLRKLHHPGVATPEKLT